MSTPPGPKGNFLLGNFAAYSRDPLGFLTSCAEKFGDVVFLRLPATRIFLLNNPHDIERVLAATHIGFINHGGMRVPLSRKLFGDGILISEGEEWRRQRRLAFPHFNHSRVVDYAAVMVKETGRMLSIWRSGETRNIYRDMIDLNLRVMSRTLFGVDLSAQTTQVAKAFDTLKDGFLVKNWWQSFGMMLPLPVKSRYKTALGTIESAAAGIIRRRRAEHSDTGDLLSVLMAAQDLEGNPISDQQLLDEVKTFLFTGHQAVGCALAWAFYLLAKNADAEAKLRSEIREILGENAPDVADIKRLNFASRVLKETLRLYPPGWAVGRESVKDCEIGGYFVPKGSQFVMSQWVVHRDLRFWDEPGEFRPERWDADLEQRLPKYAYFPHSGGARFCLGSAFAEMMSIIVIAMVAQKFHLKLTSSREVEPLPSFGLIPKGGVGVMLY
jgi:cytochrome P450